MESDNLKNESAISFYDHLTGLMTMTLFFEVAKNGCEDLFKEGKTPAVLFIDLSGMKNFNRKYGFVEGDNVLMEFSKLLCEVYGKDRCSRFVQDHFVIYTDKDIVDEKTNLLFDKWEKICPKKKLPIRVGVFVLESKDYNIVSACDNAKVATDLIRNTYVSSINYFDMKLQEDLDKRDYIVSNIDKAINEKWIKVYYQPIIRTITGKICNEEALSRWFDPEKGVLSPADFIEILEEAHLIYTLDLYGNIRLNNRCTCAG